MNEQAPLEGLHLILRCREVHDVSLQVSKTLGKVLSDIASLGLTYTFKNRHKGHNRILDKVNRKRLEGAERADAKLLAYNPDHLTDAWACRYVTLYQTQIPPVLHKLLEALDRANKEHGFDIVLSEFVIYTNRPQHDPLSIDSELMGIFDKIRLPGSTLIDKETVIRPPENKKSAYSSVHLVCSLPVKVDFPGKGSSIDVGKFEIQIRDIFEEGWGEIQHHLLYSLKDTFRTGLPDIDDTLWKPHLNALKTFVDGCSQHASIIRNSYEYTKLRRAPSSMTSASSRRDDKAAVVERVKRSGKSNAAAIVELAYDFLIAADDIQGELNEIAVDNYLAAASKFAEALDLLGTSALEEVRGRKSRTVEYFLKIELSNCYLSIRQKVLPTQLSQAKVYLSELADRFRNDVMCRFRLSQVMVRIEPTQRTFENAIQILDECADLMPSDSLLGEHHWIQLSIRMQLGFYCWRMSELVVEQGVEEKCNWLRRAVENTSGAIMLWQEMPTETSLRLPHVMFFHQAVSNALYFLAELARSNQLNEPQIRKYLGLFESVDVPLYREYYKTRDNLMRAYEAIGERRKMLQCAHENRTELAGIAERRAGRRLREDEMSSYLSDQELPNFKAAVQTIEGNHTTRK